MGNAASVQPSATVVEESLYTLARLSNNVYSLDGAFDPSKLNEDVGSYECIKESVRDNALHCKMAVWRNSAGTTVLVIKGTSTASDGTVDMGLLFGGSFSALICPTLDLANSLASEYNCTLVTGHSLGGYVAEILGTRRGMSGASFCGPGVNGPINSFGGHAHSGFQNIQFEHDLCGNWSAGVYTHVQWSVYIKCIDDAYTHGITYMCDFFRNKKHLTNTNVVAASESYPTGYYYPK